MGAAAGAAVRPGKLHNAHLALNFFFAAVLDVCQLLGGGVGDVHRQIYLPEVPVGSLLKSGELLLGEGAVKVDGNDLRSHVEAHVLTAPEAVGQPGDDVLPRVMLHQVKAPVPVDDPGDGVPRLQGVVAGVDDFLPTVVGLQHLDPPPGGLQPPGIPGLAAPLGVEGGAVQHDVEALFSLDAGDHRGLKFNQKGVLFIEFFRHR